MIEGSIPFFKTTPIKRISSEKPIDDRVALAHVPFVILEVINPEIIAPIRNAASENRLILPLGSLSFDAIAARMNSHPRKMTKDRVSPNTKVLPTSDPRFAEIS